MSAMEVFADVEQWLHDEHDYQFAKNKRTHQGRPGDSLLYIVKTEVPNKWHRFQIFHNAWLEEPEINLQARVSEQLLKVTAALRGAFVWGRVIEGVPLDEASDESWYNLTRYQRDLLEDEAVMPPDEDLVSPRFPYGSNLTPDTRVLSQRFLATSGLTVLQLLEAETAQGTYMMPQAGRT